VCVGGPGFVSMSPDLGNNAAIHLLGSSGWPDQKNGSIGSPQVCGEQVCSGTICRAAVLLL